MPVAVSQSAIIRKQVGAKVLGERHVSCVSAGDICPQPPRTSLRTVRVPKAVVRQRRL